MAITARRTMYPMAEMVEVAAEGTTVIDLVDIPEGTIIESVLVRVKTPATGDAANLIVGDAGDPDGFIVAKDAHGAAGTVYGDAPAERGVYLDAGHTHTENTAASYTQNATTALALGSSTQKLYAAAAKVRFVLSAAATGGVYQVFVTGKRFAI